MGALSDLLSRWGVGAKRSETPLAWVAPDCFVPTGRLVVFTDGVLPPLGLRSAWPRSPGVVSAICGLWAQRWRPLTCSEVCGRLPGPEPAASLARIPPPLAQSAGGADPGQRPSDYSDRARPGQSVGTDPRSAWLPPCSGKPQRWGRRSEQPLFSSQR